MPFDSIQPPRQRRHASQKQLLHIPHLTTRYAGICAVVLVVTGLLLSQSSRALAVLSAGQGAATSHSGHAVRQPQAVTKGLVAWYPLDGNASDLSMNANNGTVIGSTSYTPGKFGQALVLDGTTNYLTAPSIQAIQIGASDWTLSAWVKLSSSSGNYQIIDKRQSSPGQRYEMYIGNGFLNAHLCDNCSGATNVAVTGTKNVADNAFHLVTASFNRSGNLTTYIDGIQDATTSLAALQGDAIINSPSSLYIGAVALTNAGKFPGVIDDVRMYNRALSASEAALLYQSSQPLNCDQTCLGWWKLDESSGTVAHNGAGVGMAGTLTNFTFDNTTNGWASGVFGNGLLFNGSTDYVDFGTATALNTAGSFTASLWTKSSASLACNTTYIDKQSFANNKGFFLGSVCSGNSPSFRVFGGQGSPDLNISAINDGNWHMITGVYDVAGSTKFYLDGMLKASKGFSGTYTPEPTVNLTIGKQYNGLLDDVRVYNRALTPYEIYEQYSAGR